eukprot:1161699-Pelagomonas_calceolata.AAC.2
MPVRAHPPSSLLRLLASEASAGSHWEGPSLLKRQPVWGRLLGRSHGSPCRPAEARSAALGIGQTARMRRGGGAPQQSASWATGGADGAAVVSAAAVICVGSLTCGRGRVRGRVQPEKGKPHSTQCN